MEICCKLVNIGDDSLLQHVNMKSYKTSVIILERDMFSVCYLKCINSCLTQTLTPITDRMKTSIGNIENDNACTIHRCLDRMEYLMIIFLFLIETICRFNKKYP